jgi:hypothetical protein
MGANDWMFERDDSVPHGLRVRDGIDIRAVLEGGRRRDIERQKTLLRDIQNSLGSLPTMYTRAARARSRSGNMSEANGRYRLKGTNRVARNDLEEEIFRRIDAQEEQRHREIPSGAPPHRSAASYEEARLEGQMRKRLKRQVWDERPPRFGVGIQPGLAIADADHPWSASRARENLLDSAGLGKGGAYDETVAGFGLVDMANFHLREAYRLPIADWHEDGILRVHSQGIAEAEAALPLEPAAEDVKGELLRTLDHYKARIKRRADRDKQGQGDDDAGVRRARAAALKARFEQGVPLR